MRDRWFGALAILVMIQLGGCKDGGQQDGAGGDKEKTRASQRLLGVWTLDNKKSMEAWLASQPEIRKSYDENPERRERYMKRFEGMQARFSKDRYVLFRDGDPKEIAQSYTVRSEDGDRLTVEARLLGADGPMGKPKTITFEVKANELHGYSEKDGKKYKEYFFRR